MRMSWKMSVAAVAATVLGGYAAGTAIAAGGEEDVSRLSEPTVLDGNFPVKASDAPTIGGGKTVGSWAPGTPVSERPDFYPVALDDGTPGFVKRTDIDDELVLKELPPGMVGKIDRKLIQESLAKQRSVMVQPNVDGEIWVDVYADDAKTVIGKKLMDDVSDPVPSDD